MGAGEPCPAIRASGLIEKEKKDLNIKNRNKRSFPFLNIRLLPAEARGGKETESATSNSLIHW